MGLLDENFLTSPAGIGLLSAVAGGLAGARRGQPINSMGRAGLAGLMGYSNALTAQERAQENALQNKLRQQQLDQMDAQRRAIEQMTGTLPEDKRLQAQAFPQQFAQSLFKEPAKPQLVTVQTENGPVQRWVRPGESTGVDIGAPAQSKTSLEQMLDAAGITNPAARQMFIMRGLNKATTHAPSASANVTIKQEGEEAKTVGKGFGEAYVDLMKGDMAASGKIAKYDRMQQLLTGINTGKLTPMGTEAAALAKSVGLDLDPNLGTKQAAQAISNQLALELRNPSGGAGMPGALSDKDREFLAKSVPNLDKDPDANRKLIDYNKKLAQREKDVAKLARAYRKKKGSLDEGFYDELAVFSEKNPLFVSNSSSNILDQADAILKGGK